VIPKPPYNDGLFSKEQGKVTSSAWRQWFMALTESLPVLKSKPLMTPLQLGAIEFYDDGTTGHLYITKNVGGVLTRVQLT
jgi:hypothetical protein